MDGSMRLIKRAMVLIILSAELVSYPEVSAQVDFTYQSGYSWLKGKDATSLAVNWMSPGYDYTGWAQGKAPFHYGDGTGGTELADMMNNYPTIYLRTTFVCSNSSQIKELKIMADYDDGFILWINGNIAMSRFVPSGLPYNGFATANHESGIGEEFLVTAAQVNLAEGINHIAVQCFNISLASTDFYFDLAIHAELNLPELIDTVGVNYSVKSGFYTDPFYLTLTSPDPDLQVIYTLDGSNPQNSENTFTTGSPAEIFIDPESTTGRPLTPSVIIRASVTKPGYKPSKPVSATYIFTDKVKSQSWPGGEWPSESINGQLIDLDMDREVVNNPQYSNQIISSLMSIPSISVITDNENLFDPATGIYVNAFGHGLNWERECSVELINPDGSAGFKLNAGLRIRGGWSRNDGFPKHAFRLFFREIYGYDKLRFPLFGDEGVSQFDKIDLRCEQNYAWSNGFPNNSFVREVFSRDTQRDMGQPYTRSRYYHLYLNGMYWGLYQSQERSEARYAQSYFGGSEDDYDVIKVNTEGGYNMEATDGTTESWQELYKMCQKGFTSNADYFKIEGKDQYGRPVKGGKIMVDLDNLIDFMLVIFYTGNFDSPTAVFMQNKGCNNYYAIDDKEDNSRGFTFYVHDAEHSLFDEAHNPGIGLLEDRVNIGTRTDELKMDVASFSKFHPQWLHFKLSENPEYRLRFADRALKQFSGNGVFTPGKALARINKRISEVEQAVVAESARWGDAKTMGSYPYTKNENWIPEINKIRTRFIPYRPDIVIDQLKRAGLYTLIKAPVINGPSGAIEDTDIPVENPVSILLQNPNTSGTIYYTLDGTDPRKPGGGISTGARFSISDVKLTISTSAVLNARILAGNDWSAIRQVSFISDQTDFSDLKVTELHYHPFETVSGSDTTGGKDLEFIEFKNTGNDALNLSGLVLDSAVSYQFQPRELLAPKQFFVIASKPSKFYDYYGLVASGNFDGNLSNGGEEVLLNDSSGNELIRFTYSDTYPWPEDADGEGYSLSSKEINPSGDPSGFDYWCLSVKKDGTPFADNMPDENENPALSGSVKLSVYPNPTTGLIRVQLIADSDSPAVNVILYTTAGKIVRHETIGNPGLLDLSANGLPAGVYILKVSTSNYSARLPVILTRK